MATKPKKPNAQRVSFRAKIITPTHLGKKVLENLGPRQSQMDRERNLTKNATLPGFVFKKESHQKTN